jgi:hypothetical protein
MVHNVVYPTMTDDFYNTPVSTFYSTVGSTL